jgi:serine/threonine-protein kinase RsbW
VTELPQLKLSLPARAENVIVVRQAVAGLGEAIGLSEQRLADLKTVVSEACNNVVLHAYEEGEDGPLEVEANTDELGIDVEISDQGTGFRPRPDEDGANLGLGLPLIASLSDGFEISGAAGVGTSTRVRLLAEAREPASTNGAGPMVGEETELAIAAGAVVRPVLSRVIGALAARADFSLDRLADTVLLGDAVSSHRPGDFADGLVGVVIRDGDGTLDVRIGPLVQGGGERILSQMDLPAGDRGSLRKLAQSIRVTTSETPDGGTGEYLEIEVSR